MESSINITNEDGVLVEIPIEKVFNSICVFTSDKVDFNFNELGAFCIDDLPLSFKKLITNDRDKSSYYYLFNISNDKLTFSGCFPSK